MVTFYIPALLLLDEDILDWLEIKMQSSKQIAPFINY